jgi:hypothetical protein
MMNRLLWVSLSIIALISAGSTSAQRRGGEGFRGDPREAGTRRFESVAPQVGEFLPDVVIHDRTGKPLRLRELTRDHYTVLVLGCLT